MSKTITIILCLGILLCVFGLWGINYRQDQEIEELRDRIDKEEIYTIIFQDVLKEMREPLTQDD